MAAPMLKGALELLSIIHRDCFSRIPMGAPRMEYGTTVVDHRLLPLLPRQIVVHRNLLVATRWYPTFSLRKEVSRVVAVWLRLLPMLLLVVPPAFQSCLQRRPLGRLRPTWRRPIAAFWHPTIINMTTSPCVTNWRSKTRRSIPYRNRWMRCSGRFGNFVSCLRERFHRFLSSTLRFSGSCVLLLTTQPLTLLYLFVYIFSETC